MVSEPVLSQTDFLNDIVKLLWPNINAAGSKMVKVSFFQIRDRLPEALQHISLARIAGCFPKPYRSVY